MGSLTDRSPRSIRWASLALLIVWIGTGAPGANDVAWAAGDDLQELVVTGEQPGPALWQVRRGDHALWVLGIVAMYPKDMKWRSDEVERIIAGSQAMVSQPGVTPDSNISKLSVVFLLPTLIGVEKLPEGMTLQQVLSAPVYARWTVQREKYLGDSHRLERLRPFIAADKLAGTAYKQAGLTDDGEVLATIAKLAKKYRVKRIDADYRLFIKDPKSLIREFKKDSRDESTCLSYQLEELDYFLTEGARQSRAWATGDIGLVQSSMARKPEDPCWQEFSQIDFVKDLGIEDIENHMDEAWLRAVDEALAQNPQSFAVMKMREVLNPNGLLARLRARGYTVTGPTVDGSSALR